MSDQPNARSASRELTQLARSIAMEIVERTSPLTTPDGRLEIAEAVALRHLIEAFTANPLAKAARQAAPRRSGPIRNITNGTIYPSATEAARALYVSPSSVANHLNNPERVPTVAGCILERVNNGT